MSKSSVPAPSIRLVSFSCPTCGAHASQTWYSTRVVRLSDKHPCPIVLSLESIEELEADAKNNRDANERAAMETAAKYFRKMLAGKPFFEKSEETIYTAPTLENVFVSRCYTCRAVAIWLHDRLIYPSATTGPSPNLDLSEDVLRDYEEARIILDLSPRGAAALLRLAIEKICIELGAEGRDLDKRIAFLVSQGLPPEVQQALDAVRVIGNEAVHPGQIDLRDDHETASELFDLVNFIAYDRITRPKQIKALYEIIPQDKRKGIEERNTKATKRQ